MLSRLRANAGLEGLYLAGELPIGMSFLAGETLGECRLDIAVELVWKEDDCIAAGSEGALSRIRSFANVELSLSKSPNLDVVEILGFEIEVVFPGSSGRVTGATTEGRETGLDGFQLRSRSSRDGYLCSTEIEEDR